ncbi:MAG: FxsA family protein [Myxococcota bacterium]
MLALLGLFIFLPALELYLLILLGTEVGALNTLLLILVTGTLGAALVRQQGLDVFQRIQRESAAGRLPALELVEGLVLVIAGALLVTPGLITDGAGFLALVAPLRRRAAQALADRVVVGAQSQVFRVQMAGRPDASRPRSPPPGGPVIDVEGRSVPPSETD